MKGRIVEINGDTAIVFTKSATFVKTKNFGNATIGDEITIPTIAVRYSKAIAATAAAVMIFAGGIASYCTPVSYVDVCINPEIELKINMFDVVIGADGKNDDGEAVIAQGGMKNMKIDAALDNILENAEELGFIPEDAEKTVVLSVFAKNEKNARQVYENIDAHKMPEKINKVVKLADETDMTNATEANMSVGKYLLVNELAEISENISVEEIRNYSVKDIINTLDEANAFSKAEVVEVQEAATPQPADENEQIQQNAVSDEKKQDDRRDVVKSANKTVSAKRTRNAAIKNKDAEKPVDVAEIEMKYVPDADIEANIPDEKIDTVRNDRTQREPEFEEKSDNGADFKANDDKQDDFRAETDAKAQINRKPDMDVNEGYPKPDEHIGGSDISDIKSDIEHDKEKDIEANVDFDMPERSDMWEMQDDDNKDKMHNDERDKQKDNDYPAEKRNENTGVKPDVNNDNAAENAGNIKPDRDDSSMNSNIKVNEGEKGENNTDRAEKDTGVKNDAEVGGRKDFSDIGASSDRTGSSAEVSESYDSDNADRVGGKGNSYENHRDYGKDMERQ